MCCSDAVPLHRRSKELLPEHLCSVTGPPHRRVHLIPLPFLERPQDVLHRITPLAWVPDPHLDPQKVSAAERLHDGPDTLMATMTPAGLDPQLGGGEIEVVV